jgi:thiol-disulfide isomerase/thioredoxin
LFRVKGNSPYSTMAVSVVSWVVMLVQMVLYVATMCSASVIDISPKNFDEMLASQPLLIEFYAPYCGFCTRFEGSYKEVGQILEKEHQITTSRADVSNNMALASRFDISSIPTVFLVRDNLIWRFSGQLSVESLVKFSTEAYLTEDPIPYWRSALGPMGILKGAVLKVERGLADFVAYLSTSFNVPTYLSYILVALSFAFVILLITGIGIYWSVTAVHSKKN